MSSKRSSGYDGQQHYCPGLQKGIDVSDIPIVKDPSFYSGLALITTEYERRYQSRTALEGGVIALQAALHREQLRRWATENRLEREMEASIRIGAQLLRAEEKIRRLKDRLHFAQCKLGHKV